jgi:nitrogen fixation NifU-like protein
MTTEDLSKEVILDHYRRPRNRRVLDAPTATASITNPTCGDVVTVQVLERDGRVEAVAYDGHGCSISQSSASMMTAAVAGRDRAAIGRLEVAVRAMLSGREPTADAGDLGDLEALAGVARYPVRIRCALLAWDALDEALGAGPVD